MVPLKVILIILMFVMSDIVCKYVTLPNDTRSVEGKENAAFEYNTTLPGVYTQVTVNSEKIKLENGNCSSTFFKCSYKQEEDDLMYVSMSGIISKDLKWTIFSGTNIVPINILFFVNYTWNDLTMGTFQPQYSTPLIVLAKGKQTVTITCTIFPKLLLKPSYKLSTGLNNTVYYQQTALTTKDNTKDHRQILNLEVRDVILHKVNTITVRQLQEIDFYSCEYGDESITHTIDWTKEQQTATESDSAGAASIQFAIFAACLLQFAI